MPSASPAAPAWCHWLRCCVTQRLSVARSSSRLGISSRTLVELPYADELAEAGAMIALTREDVVGGRAAARIGVADLEPLIVPDATYFVCGSASFAEAASMLLLDLGVPAELVRVERFGPSG